MAKKKTTKTNFGEIEKLHKNEIIDTGAIKTEFPINYDGEKFPDNFKGDEAGQFPTITDKEWQEIEDLRKQEKEKDDWERGLKIFRETGIQLVNTEAEWITQIRDYCRENKILPTHLIEIHKEWLLREEKYNQTFKTEKAPD